ncbi:putative serine/threonine-protein kinase [Hordeum vulgare]|nr:putative serine/threonine-protein kinase [Hordeum vulgare]
MPLLIHLRVLLVAAGLAVCRGYPTDGAGDARAYNSSMCQRSFPCGGLNIHYPLYLSNESKVVDGVAYSYCGYPGMAVLCDDSRATLQLAWGTNYTVLGIDYDNHTITLADADILASNGGCPRPRHNVTIPREAWLNFTPTGNTTISFFLNCSLAAPPPPDVVPINCTGFDPGRGSFLAPQLGAPDFDPSVACNEVYVAPVLTGEWLTSPEHRRRLGDGGYGDVLRRGFRLSWDPSAGPCFRCELSGGRCSYNQLGGFLGCLCSDGRVRTTDCGKTQNSLFLVLHESWLLSEAEQFVCISIPFFLIENILYIEMIQSH